MGSRRNFIKKTALLSLSGIAANAISNEKLDAIEKLTEKSFLTETFTLAPLPYSYDALEPFIDKQTMELHHDKHHQAYVTNLNKALETSKHPAASSLEDIFTNITAFTDGVRNNAGGHYNHTLFWSLMKENKDAKPNLPGGKIADAINASFTSFDEFKKQFAEAGMKRFGSGWAWLVEEKGKLKITSTPNQDNTLMSNAETKGSPVLALDVWEHAYYLKYQNKRADYINYWWNVVNWDKAAELLSKAK
ncbi:MAG TPA: superoxide dismutase [Bacteroidia bacterium]|jgi:Fe-Mn family superoxide dismutase|nr:superoxide dismutase [Bacteroidia bacterium]